MSNGTEDDQNAPIPSPGEPDPPAPDPNWDYIELGVYVAERFKAGRSLEDQATGLGRRTAVQMWYAGQALDIVHKREVRDRGWKVWCQAHGFNVDTCYQALRLFRRSGGIENIRQMTITEARSHYQTGKGTWTPPGAEPANGKPQGDEQTNGGQADAGTEGTAATAETTPTEGTTETTQASAESAGGPQGGEQLSIAGRLREDLEDLREVADALAKPDAAIEEADAALIVQRIDEVMARLREAKKVLTARAKIKAKSSVRARGKVGDDQ